MKNSDRPQHEIWAIAKQLAEERAIDDALLGTGETYSDEHMEELDFGNGMSVEPGEWYCE